MHSSLLIEDFLYRINGKSIKVDSREIELGDYYIAFKGNTYDGNDFVLEALKNGAAGALSDSLSGENILKVDNTKKFILSTAKYILKKNENGKRIAITGSTGKTTTKEILFYLLSKLGKTFKTEGNMNTEIGIPLSLIKDKDAFINSEYSIFEMGTDKPGDIPDLVNFIHPDISILTNFGTQHRGNFKNIERHIQEKMSIFDNNPKLSVSFVNIENDLINKNTDKIKGEVIKYGKENSNFVLKHYEYLNNSTIFSFEVFNEQKFLKLKGIWNSGQLNDFGAAYLVAKKCGLEEPVFFMINYVLPYSNRFTLKKIKGRIFIDDSYNSSLESLSSATDSISKMNANKKIAVLGSIFDQGRYSRESHREIKKYLFPFDEVLLYNPDKQIDEINNHEKIVFLSDRPYEISKWLLENTTKGDLIYLKASRAVKIEEVIHFFEELE